MLWLGVPYLQTVAVEIQIEIEVGSQSAAASIRSGTGAVAVAGMPSIEVATEDTVVAAGIAAD